RHGPFEFETGAAALAELWAADPAPTAVFCGNDVVAIGVIDTARRLGIAIPEQLSVVGFDDTPMASWASFELSTVRHDLDEMACTAARLLVARVSGDDAVLDASPDPSAAGDGNPADGAAVGNGRRTRGVPGEEGRAAGAPRRVTLTPHFVARRTHGAAAGESCSAAKQPAEPRYIRRMAGVRSASSSSAPMGSYKIAGHCRFV